MVGQAVATATHVLGGWMNSYLTSCSPHTTHCTSLPQGFAARHLQSLTPSTGSSSSSKTDDDAAAPQHHQQHHKQQQQLLHHQQQHTLQQQHHLQEHQQQPTSSWLEQLTHCSSSSSRQERLAALSRLTISLHGRAAELAGTGWACYCRGRKPGSIVTVAVAGALSVGVGRVIR